MNAEQVEHLRRFIAERLDDDERIALAAADGNRAEEWTVRYAGAGAGVDSADGTVAYDEGFPNGEQSEHIASHDPARVLRDVKTKRAMLAAIASLPDGPDLLALLKVMALTWDAHPAYDERWRPDGYQHWWGNVDG